jgi:hypothetical protein
LPLTHRPKRKNGGLQRCGKSLRRRNGAEYISANTLTPTVLYGEDFRDFLISTKNGFEVVLREVGAIE